MTTYLELVNRVLHACGKNQVESLTSKEYVQSAQQALARAALEIGNQPYTWNFQEEVVLGNSVQLTWASNEVTLPATAHLIKEVRYDNRRLAYLDFLTFNRRVSFTPSEGEPYYYTFKTRRVANILVLDYYPPNADRSKLKIIYSKKWTLPTLATDVVDYPDYIVELFVMGAKGYFKSTEDSNMTESVMHEQEFRKAINMVYQQSASTSGSFNLRRIR